MTHPLAKAMPPREPGTIRVCPERDARCPHGLNCPYWIDRGSCKPEGLRAGLQALKDTK